MDNNKSGGNNNIYTKKTNNMITLMYYFPQDNRWEAYVRFGQNGRWRNISNWKAQQTLKLGKWDKTEKSDFIKYKKQTL